jgi:hypothetical protein
MAGPKRVFALDIPAIHVLLASLPQRRGCTENGLAEAFILNANANDLQMDAVRRLRRIAHPADWPSGQVSRVNRPPI